MIKVNNLNKTFKVHKKDPGFWGSVKSLTHRKYIEKPALIDLNLEIAEGEIIGLIGGNGAGKTTLIKLLVRLYEPTKGNIYLDGINIKRFKKSEYQKRFGAIFQDYVKYYLTAKENVEFVMLLQGKSASEREARVKELLAAVGLSEHLERRPAELSGGQQQRVAVARALASKPQFVLADDAGLRVDEHMMTSEPDVYAAGDVCTACWEHSALWQQVNRPTNVCISLFEGFFPHTESCLLPHLIIITSFILETTLNN